MTTVTKRHLVRRDLRSRITANIEGASTQAGSGDPSPTNIRLISDIATDPVTGFDISSWNLLSTTTIKDVYDYSTKKITRKIGKLVLDGVTTGHKVTNASALSTFYYSQIVVTGLAQSLAVMCTHLLSKNAAQNHVIYTGTNNITFHHSYSTADACNEWLKAEYDAGHPVTIYYQLTESMQYVEDAAPLYSTSLPTHQYADKRCTLKMYGKNMWNMAKASSIEPGYGSYTYDEATQKRTYTNTSGSSAARIQMNLSQEALGLVAGKQYTVTVWSDNLSSTADNLIYVNDSYLIFKQESPLILTWTQSNAGYGVTVGMLYATNYAEGATFSVWVQVEEGDTSTAFELYTEEEKSIPNKFYSTAITKEEVSE